MENQENKKKGFFDLSEVFGYFFKKRNPDNKPDFNTRAMHIINKIAISVFLLGILYFVAKKMLF